MIAKAIDTIYNHRKFRSRLEARYAVFFDSLGLPYQYEPEGYNLEGEFYLPGFYLPSIKLWVEVKGKRPTEQEERLLRLLVKHTQTSATFLGPFENYVSSDIVFSAYTNYGFHGYYCYNKIPDNTSDSSWSHVSFDFVYLFCECRHCGAIGYQFDGRSARIPCCDTNKKIHKDGYDKDYNFDSPRLLRAYEKAMQARFEHGEKG
jgi:hypothetical protein